MSKFYKIVLYIVACTVVFLILAQIYGGLYSRKAEAFEWEKEVVVYFSNDKLLSSEGDCKEVFPVYRRILNAEILGPGALEALFKGPTAEEGDLGYNTNINLGALINMFEIRNGIAYVDFSSEFSKGVAGSCRVTAIRSQVEKTLLNIPDIHNVVISVEGRTEGVLEP